MLLTYAGGLFAGAKLIEHKITNVNSGEIYTLGNIITVFFTLLNSFQCIGMLNSPMNAITKGRVSAATIFAILDQKPGIKQKDTTKITPESLKGDIEFKNVKFNYPSRPKVKVLDGIDLKIPQGKKIALVGHTGCGKSTIIQLIERFYDPDQGQVLIDGKNLSEYNLHGFRKFVGYVGQEPVLFSMSIKANLLLAKEDATDEQLETALKQANAWLFVQKLEDQWDTYVGPGGSQLSGGQKQRIAIARAILLNPSILLLDESTSALDRKNEREIQETLDHFSKNRTTVTIAHRLATIKNSDLIYCLQDGKIAESGPHDDLIKIPDGVYAKLIEHQFGESKKKDRRTTKDGFEKVDQISDSSSNSEDPENVDSPTPIATASQNPADPFPKSLASQSQKKIAHPGAEAPILEKNRASKS